jgi:hypothetical protein
MTTNLVRRKSRRRPIPEAKVDPPEIAIGETNARLFDCPSCARPLSNGTMRCPGCGARLIHGVRIKRAGGILALGVAVGVLFGGTATVAAIALSLRGAAPVPAAVGATGSAGPLAAGTVPTTAVPTTTDPTDPTLPDGAPRAAVIALSGTAVVNGRITVDAITLGTTLARPAPSAIDLARVIRSLSADATLGLDQAQRLGPWRDAGPVMTKLEAFYHTMQEKARIALQFSLTDDASYRRSAAEMKTVLAGLADLDAASRALAATVELELPPVVVPVLAP